MSLPEEKSTKWKIKLISNTSCGNFWCSSFSKGQMCMLYGASKRHFHTAWCHWCSIGKSQTELPSFLLREKLHPEGRSTKGMSFFHAELFLYIWQRYNFIKQQSIMIQQTQRIIVGWAVRICCADLCQCHSNLVPILEVFWILIVRYSMRDKSKMRTKRFLKGLKGNQ